MAEDFAEDDLLADDGRTTEDAELVEEFFLPVFIFTFVFGPLVFDPLVSAVSALLSALSAIKVFFYPPLSCGRPAPLHPPATRLLAFRALPDGC